VGLLPPPPPWPAHSLISFNEDDSLPKLEGMGFEFEFGFKFESKAFDLLISLAFSGGGWLVVVAVVVVAVVVVVVVGGGRRGIVLSSGRI